DVVDLMHFLRQRINDTLRGSDAFTVKDILTGDAHAGEAYFNAARGRRACHSPTGDLAGVASRLPAPVDVQERMLFPTRRLGRGGAPSRTDVSVTLTPSSGAPVTGTLVAEDDFFVSLRDSAGALQVVRKAPGVKVATS